MSTPKPSVLSRRLLLGAAGAADLSASGRVDATALIAQADWGAESLFLERSRPRDRGDRAGSGPALDRGWGRVRGGRVAGP